MHLATFPGGAATDDVGAILERLLTVERTLRAREPKGRRVLCQVCKNQLPLGSARLGPVDWHSSETSSGRRDCPGMDGR